MIHAGYSLDDPRDF